MKSLKQIQKGRKEIIQTRKKDKKDCSISKRNREIKLKRNKSEGYTLSSKMDKLKEFINMNDKDDYLQQYAKQISNEEKMELILKINELIDVDYQNLFKKEYIINEPGLNIIKEPN